MKNLIAICLVVLFASCQQDYMQVLETKSTNAKEENNNYVYENDMVKVTYQFWHDQGLMAFSVYNKTDAPIYIDWAKSSFVYNSSKINYWTSDKRDANGGYFDKYCYNGPVMAPGYNISEEVGVRNSSKAYRAEKVSFIPPQSHYYRSQFRLMPEEFIPMDKDKYQLVTCNEDAKAKTKVYETAFEYKNSPLVVRNYLTVSSSEKFDKEVIVDNEFYVSSVKAMYIGHALGKNTKQKDDNGQFIYELPFKKNTSFYILHYDVTRVAGLKNERYNTKF